MSANHAVNGTMDPHTSTAGARGNLATLLTTGGWFATGLVTLLALLVRVIRLGQPARIIFDETYYAKDAWSLFKMGYEGSWDEHSDIGFALGTTSGLTPEASFVVHPPLGRWLIALGFLGTSGGPTPFAWRISAAIFGVLGVFLAARIAWQISRSVVAVSLSGVFLATDGLHVAMSRVALLDIFMSTLVLLAVWAVLRDGTSLRGTSPPHSTWWRPYLALAGVALGCAVAVKWSALWSLAVIGLFVAIRDWARKKQRGHLTFLSAVSGAASDFVYLVGTTALVYVTSWWSWFRTPQSWGRPGSGKVAGNGTPWSDWWAYHERVWEFHQGVTAPHSYQSSPTDWVLQTKPTLLYFNRVPGCKTGCVEIVSTLGNPLLWWLGLGAAIWALAMILRHRPEASNLTLLLVVYASQLLPWFLYPERTKFSFYAASLAPYVAILLGLGLTWLTQSPRPRWLRRVSWLLALAVVASGFWFLPIATGFPISIEQWEQHKLLESWW